jgi:hypothetical protein
VIHHLQYVRREVDLGSLAERVAAWELDLEPVELNSDQRKRVYTSLQQFHLPRLDDAGVVAFDDRAGTVAPTEALLEIRIYTEVVDGNDIPWSRYYLGLGALLLAAAGGAAAGLPVVGSVPATAWGPFCSVTVLAFALTHVVLARGTRLGTTPAPPEVEHHGER